MNSKKQKCNVCTLPVKHALQSYGVQVIDWAFLQLHFFETKTLQTINVDMEEYEPTAEPSSFPFELFSALVYCCTYPNIVAIVPESSCSLRSWTMWQPTTWAQALNVSSNEQTKLPTKAAHEPHIFVATPQTCLFVLLFAQASIQCV
jgi:hypothetical protein